MAHDAKDEMLATGALGADPVSGKGIKESVDAFTAVQPAGDEARGGGPRTWR